MVSLMVCTGRRGCPAPSVYPHSSMAAPTLCYFRRKLGRYLCAEHCRLLHVCALCKEHHIRGRCRDDRGRWLRLFVRRLFFSRVRYRLCPVRKWICSGWSLIQNVRTYQSGRLEGRLWTQEFICSRHLYSGAVQTCRTSFVRSHLARAACC